MMPFFSQSCSDMLAAFEQLPARQFPRMLASVTDPEELGREYRDMVRRFYDRAYRGGNVVDKTPSIDGVETVPFIQSVFPEARFVFCHRRALENVESRLRKWPAVPFDAHCREWGETMSLWRRVRRDLPPGHYREIELRRSILDLEGTVQNLKALVGCDDDAAQRMRATLTEESPSMIEGSEVGRVLDLDSMGWTASERASFLKTCRSELDSWGYSLDARYFADSTEATQAG